MRECTKKENPTIWHWWPLDQIQSSASVCLGIHRVVWRYCFPLGHVFHMTNLCSEEEGITCSLQASIGRGFSCSFSFCFVEKKLFGQLEVVAVLVLFVCSWEAISRFVFAILQALRSPRYTCSTTYIKRIPGGKTFLSQQRGEEPGLLC